MANPAPLQRFIVQVKEARGLISARSEQTLADFIDSFSEFFNITIRDGGYRIRPADNNAAITGSPVWGVHVYNAIDTATPGSNPFGCVLYASGGATNFTGTATLRRVDQFGDSVVSVNGVTNFTFTSPFDISFLNIKNRCFVAANVPAASVVPIVVTQFPSATSYPWGIAAPTNEMTYDAYTNATNTTTMVYFKAADANVAAATTAVVTSTGNNFVWPATTWSGKSIYIDNAAAPYTISSTTATNSLTMTTNYALTTGIANKDFRVHYGELSWTDIPPSYAYAYYNPTTFHISNISPILRISEKNISTVRVNISNIQCTGDANYTKIVLFRTDTEGGGTLYPLKLNSGHGGSAGIDANGLINNTGAGTVNYVDFQGNQKLGAVLGKVQAPQFNNKPPAADIKMMEYWDARIWYVRTSEPNRVYFSGSVSEVPLGVPEESFPASNYRDIPSSSDGAFSSLKVVGNSLLLGADNYMYTVAGSGESTSYVLQRISSRGAGVNRDAIAEFPGDTVEESASAIYLSRDNRLWRHLPGGRIDDIGWPIQDKLDTIDNTLIRPALVRVAQIGKNWYVCLGIRSGTTRYDWYFYDLEAKMWNDWGFAGAGVGWGSMWYGVIYRLVGDLPNGQPLTYMGTTGTNITVVFNNLGLPETVNGAGAAISTQWLDFGDRMAKKTLQEVILHVNDATFAGWQAQIGFDGGGIGNMDLMTVSSSPRDPGSSNTLRYVYRSSGPVQFHSVKVRALVPAISTSKINKIEIVYRLDSTGQVDG